MWKIMADTHPAERSQSPRHARRGSLRGAAAALAAPVAFPKAAWRISLFFSPGLVSVSFFFLLALLSPYTVLGAELHWQAMPDRERLSIRLSENEGMAGPIARISPTAILIPFTRVPPDLVVLSSPKGAKLFKNTSAEGRALALHTQSPEFGFMVTAPSHKEVVIDLFNNPLGARWKPTGVAPTTEVPPDTEVNKQQGTDAASQALAREPEGKGPLSRQAQAPSAGQPVPDAKAPAREGGSALRRQTASPVEDKGRPPVQDAVSGAASPAGTKVPAPAAAATPSVSDEQKKPTVVTLTGSPIHAAEVTAQAEPPAGPSAPSPAGMLQNPGADAKAARNDRPASSAGSLAAMPILEVRARNADSSVQLPMPEPPLSIPLPAKEQASPPQTSPQALPQNPASPALSVRIPVAPGAAPALPSPRPVPSRPDTALSETPGPGRASEAAAGTSGRIEEAGRKTGTPAGRAARIRPGLYRGSVNMGGQEPPSDPAREQSPQGESGRQNPQPTSFFQGTVVGPGQSALSRAQADISSQVQVSPGEGPAMPEEYRPVADLQSEAAPVAPAAGLPSEPERTGADAAAHPGPQGQEPGEAQAQELVPGIPELTAALQDAMDKGEYPEAQAQAENLLLRTDLDNPLREELLHIKAEMLFAAHKDNFGGFYTPISDATMLAINFNPRSPRNAAALLRLGYMNLKTNNLPEATANFNMLRRLFPQDENVPLSYYYWGEHYFEKNELQKAADEFQLILQKYPNSPYAREAALGLARSLYRLGYYDQSFTIVDYIEKRWPQFYIAYPPFLNMVGDVAYRLDKQEQALKYYWLYINLLPEGEDSDIVLTRLGDIYAAKRENAAATEMYRESMRRFPDKDGGIIAMMRLAERSINDAPSIAGMFSIFEGPYSLEPLRVYQSIIKDHPGSALVPLAKIKLAMWHLWKKDFTTALDEVTDFLQKYPDHELAPRAKEVAMQAFAVLASDSVADGNYSRMHEIWERYPIVHSQGEYLSPDSRIALGVSYWKDGKPNEALDTVAPFFLGKKVPEYSEMALSLVLSIYLEFDQWQSILDVAAKVDLWEIKPESRLQLDYALALAHENLNHPEKAGPIWQKLYDGDKLPPAQKAYAVFFLARHAEKDRELEKAYTLGKEALSKLLVQSERSNNPSDLNKIKSQLASLMDMAETAGRLREALGFADQYLKYLDANETERTTVRYRVARIHKKQGDLDGWRKILADIAAKDPTSVYGQIASSELKAAAIAEDAARYSPTGKL